MRLLGHDKEIDDAFRKTTLLVTYRRVHAKKNELIKSEAVSRGTGFFLQIGDHNFVCTNTHILHKYAFLKQEGQMVSVQVAVSSGTPGIENHEGYCLSNLDLDEYENPRDKYNHIDVALIRLTPQAVEEINQFKEFITQELIDLSLPEPGSLLYYMGYPEAFVDFDKANKKVDAKGRTHFLEVKEATNSVIVLDRVDDTVDLHGISGSALFDADMHLRGMVWGVYGNLMYAPPSQHSLDFTKKCINIRGSE